MTFSDWKPGTLIKGFSKNTWLGGVYVPKGSTIVVVKIEKSPLVWLRKANLYRVYGLFCGRIICGDGDPSSWKKWYKQIS